jgi:hypothetical protein
VLTAGLAVVFVLDSVVSWLRWVRSESAIGPA